MFKIRPLEPTDVEILAAIYCACFAEYPWCEDFTLEEVINEILGVMKYEDAVMAVAEANGSVIGASWLFNLHRKVDVMDLVGIPRTSPYISEIFVAPHARLKGVANALVSNILSRASSPKHGAVRTSVEQPAIIRLFEKLGWKIVTTETVISKKRINGSVVDAPDTRVILVGSVT